MHGGAIIEVVQMFEHLKETIKDWKDQQELDKYLNKMLKKEAYDKKGLIYGIGHAVYTPLFALSRVAGWTAHRIEELNFTSKRIIRPAYKNVREKMDYKPLNKS